MARSAARTQFLTDVLTTAVDGGISYWAEADSLDRNSEGYVLKVNALTLLDDPDEAPVDVDLGTVARGIGRIVRGEVKVNREITAYILLGNRENDAAEIDSDAADVIVQAGLYGEIVFG